MNRDARGAVVKSFLIDDELVEVLFRGDRFPYRLRIWRNKGGPAIVLTSQVPGGAPPACLRSRLANLAFRAFLGFPAEGMFYFEDERTQGGRRLLQVKFHSVGHGLRRHLIGAVERPMRWDDFFSIIGSEVIP